MILRFPNLIHARARPFLAVASLTKNSALLFFSRESSTFPFSSSSFSLLNCAATASKLVTFDGTLSAVSFTVARKAEGAHVL